MIWMKYSRDWLVPLSVAASTSLPLKGNTWNARGGMP